MASLFHNVLAREDQLFSYYYSYGSLPRPESDFFLRVVVDGPALLCGPKCGTLGLDRLTACWVQGFFDVGYR